MGRLGSVPRPGPEPDILIGGWMDFLKAATPPLDSWDPFRSPTLLNSAQKAKPFLQAMAGSQSGPVEKGRQDFFRLGPRERAIGEVVDESQRFQAIKPLVKGLMEHGRAVKILSQFLPNLRESDGIQVKPEGIADAGCLLADGRARRRKILGDEAEPIFQDLEAFAPIEPQRFLIVA